MQDRVALSVYGDPGILFGSFANFHFEKVSHAYWETHFILYHHSLKTQHKFPKIAVHMRMGIINNMRMRMNGV